MESLKIEEIIKTYQRKTVLHGVSFSVQAGEVIGLLGSNGAGKTTLMKTIAGLSLPDAGTVKIFGMDGRKQRSEIKRIVGFVPQENNMERELNIKECLMIYARLFQVKNPGQCVAAIIKQFTMNTWETSKVEHLSGGMARRALIARAMIPKPEILLLDEPSVGLDPDMRQEVWQAIAQLKAAGKTIVITTHYMEEAERLCDRIALLKEGRLLCMDTTENIKYMAQQANQLKENITLEKAFLHLIRKEGA
ncbi:MAG: yadG [Firmicutes bacterium]|nr:yadG [Bacillota bacterium]